MARGTTLMQCVTKLRARTGMSTDPAQGINSLEMYKLRLKEEQERLYQDYDWPFLMGPYDVEMEAGERYYDLPVEPESIQKVEYKWGGVWQELCYGINGEHYNSRDSDLDQRLDPIQRWQMRVDKTNDSLIDNEQFEAWPIPATDDQVTVRFWGKRRLGAFIANDDKCTLDDLLIVLYSAATIVKNAEDRKLLIAEAESHYKRLRGRNKKTKMFVLGGGGGELSRPKPGPVRVAYTLATLNP